MQQPFDREFPASFEELSGRLLQIIDSFCRRMKLKKLSNAYHTIFGSSRTISSSSTSAFWASDTNQTCYPSDNFIFINAMIWPHLKCTFHVMCIYLEVFGSWLMSLVNENGNLIPIHCVLISKIFVWNGNLIPYWRIKLFLPHSLGYSFP